MKKPEIEHFIRRCTPDFERELRQKRKNVKSFPYENYAKTAAINLQRRCDFDQHNVIQQKWQALADYIVKVILINHFQINFSFSVHG